MPTAEAAPSTLSSAISPSADRDTDLEHEKATFRVAATLRRSDAARHAGPDAGDRLADRFLAAIPAVTPETVVSGYFPIGEEMDPRPLMARLAAAGCTLCLPVTPRRGLPLTFRQWRPGDPLRARPFGLSEPLPEAPAAEPDLLLVPLLAFDAAGRRMGYGGGFYDRTLAGLRARRTVRAIGVAFDGQFCDRVPAGPHDARLDAIVTEAAFYPAAAAGIKPAMRMLFCGDVVGRSGREAVTSRLPALRRRHGIDFVVVNGENAAAGFGITEAICREFFAAGVDVVTTGNHLFDKREIVSTLAAEPRLLRPANYPPGTPGQGATAFTLADGRRVVVANLMTRLFMDPLDCPFAAIDALLPAHPMGAGAAAAILVDVHGEATSEKMAMGHHLDGRVSAVFGSHSHVPTADAQILSRGTAYQTDAGMCGDYDSVIGMRKEGAVARFVKKVPGERLSPADGEGTMCGVFVATDDATGLALSVAPVRLGGRLMQSHPPD